MDYRHRRGGRVWHRELMRYDGIHIIEHDLLTMRRLYPARIVMALDSKSICPFMHSNINAWRRRSADARPTDLPAFPGERNPGEYDLTGMSGHPHRHERRSMEDVRDCV